ncbi:MAG: hypothetical protein ACLFT7_05245 [Thermoplasmata archaeon]
MNKDLATILFGVILVWFIVLLSAAALTLFAVDYIAGTTYFGLRNILILTALYVVLTCVSKGGD